MLNKYIEKRITDKITILNILLDIRSIELDELSTLTSLQSKSLLSIAGITRNIRGRVDI